MFQKIKSKILILISFFTLATTLLLPSYILATDEAIGANSNEINLNAPGNYSKLGEIKSENMIGGLINLIYILSTFTFFFVLLIGGVKWITSAGDEKKLTAARSSITHGAIGLGIVFVAWALMTLIGELFNFDPFKLQITPFTNNSSPVNNSAPIRRDIRNRIDMIN